MIEAARPRGHWLAKFIGWAKLRTDRPTWLIVMHVQTAEQSSPIHATLCDETSSYGTACASVSVRRGNGSNQRRVIRRRISVWSHRQLLAADNVG